MTTDTSPALNEEQAAAVADLEEFCTTPFAELDSPFFLLKGPAGTGKTFCIRHLIPRLKGRLVFTAPTNKATKVLRESVTSPDYRPECRTIYSLLGLKMEANGEIKELAIPDDPIDLTKFSAVVVDESSMVNHELLSYIKTVADVQRVRFIFMGDEKQLPPVKESRAAVMDLANQAVLDKVMRHDNQILALVTRIRHAQSHPAPSIKLASDNDGQEGVWVGAATFDAAMRAEARRGAFLDGRAKAIAWRNATVDGLNRAIRRELFAEADETFWLPSDRVAILTRVLDPSNEAKPLATTDDEGIVKEAEVCPHPEYSEVNCWRLAVTLDDGKFLIIYTLHPSSQRVFEARKATLAAEAKATPRLWRKFWAFVDAFPVVRHGYAITAHRSQGSTYETAFVDWRDILINRQRLEAFQCLYVACSRPKKRLYLN